MLRIFKWTLIVVLVFSLIIFIGATDLNQVSASLRMVGVNFSFLLLITFLAYVCATIGWRYCFQSNTQKIFLSDLFLIRHIGEMVALINPASVVGGEATKVYLLKNKHIDATSSITSLLLSRLMMAVTQILLFVLTAVYVVINNEDLLTSLPTYELSKIPLMALSGIAITFYIIFKNSKRIAQTPRFARLNERIRTKLRLEDVLPRFRHFFETDKKGLILCTLFFMSHWLIGSMEIYFLLKFLGIEAGIPEVIFVDMGIIIFKSAGIFVPGQIGVEELGNKIMLGLIGVSEDGVWMTVSILRRARQLFWICFGGSVYLLFYKRLNGL